MSVYTMETKGFFIYLKSSKMSQLAPSASFEYLGYRFTGIINMLPFIAAEVDPRAVRVKLYPNALRSTSS